MWNDLLRTNEGAHCLGLSRKRDCMKNICNLPTLFLGLCLSPLAGAQAGTTLLVKTDMSCNWKLDRQSMGILKADDPTVVLVSPGEHLIEASATDGVATARTRVDVAKAEKTVSIQLKSQNPKTTNDQQAKMEPAEAPRKPAGAKADTTSIWTDPATGLMWTRKDNGSDVNEVQADAYCSKLQLAGYSGWRLPTMEELQGIYDPRVSAQAPFDSGLTYNVHIKGNLTLTGRIWSDLREGDLGRPYEVQAGWLFQFGDTGPSDVDLERPQRNFLLYSSDTRALCVRGAGE